ncbi:putative motility protein [uncultured Oscillibacter sp.]|uniref:putative motility protein n=1 Tax=uncultured Oscillibacter sp. TaxID=876091 RepID=UPI0025EB8119|nr:putative motility protein [uncultured Oscillibacter sp.]
MNEVALASMQISSARLATQYAMSLQKQTMSDMEQQAMGELEMLPPTPGLGEYIDTYA